MKKTIRLITLCSFFMVFCLFSSVYAQNVWTEASSNQDVFFGTQNKVTSDLHASKTYKLDVAALKKQLEKLLREKASTLAIDLKKNIEEIQGVNFLVSKVDLDVQGIKSLAFELGKAYSNLFLVFASSENNEKAMLTCYISKELVEQKEYDAGKVVRELGKFIDGGGGGQKFFATAGGKNPKGIPEALAKAKKYIVG